MKKILVVIDMQNDFITGSLGSPLTQAIVPNVVKKCQEYKNNGNMIFYTQDTHYGDYLNTLEGKKLPVKHCIIYEQGWDIIPEIDDALSNGFSIFKTTFGCIDIADEILCELRVDALLREEDEDEDLEEKVEIEIIGVCTDICVVSNALILRASFPDTKITVDASCCAGTSVEAHQAALTVMKSCQIDVIGE